MKKRFEDIWINLDNAGGIVFYNEKIDKNISFSIKEIDRSKGIKADSLLSLLEIAEIDFLPKLN